MKTILAWLLFLLTFTGTTFCESKKPDGNWQDVIKELGLLESDSPGRDTPNFAGLARKMERPLADGERSLFYRDSAGDWERFSDEWISFDLPKDELLNVDVFTPDEQPRLQGVGSSVGTSDRSFRKVYRLTVGKDRLPYGMIFLSENTWFDEGICLCGAIQLKTFVHRDGNLIELSQLGDAALKKVEVLNDTHRAILFEWTHSALTQKAYARIGCSLRLNSPSKKTREDWIRHTKKMRELEGNFGWLRKGMSTDQIQALVSEKPQAIDNKSIRYTKETLYPGGGRAQDTFTIPLVKGKLVSLPNNWMGYEDLPSVHGSDRWVNDTLDSEHDLGLSDDEESEAWSIEPKDLQFILNRILKEGPLAKEYHWSTICNWINTLADHDIKRPELIELVVKRSSINELPQDQTRWVLENYQHPTLKEFVTSRLKFILGDSELAADYQEEAWNLFASLERTDPGASDLVRKAVESSKKEVRVPGVDRASWLPNNEAREVLKKALLDKSSHLRFFAIGEISSVFNLKDKEWLEEISEKESDSRNLQRFKEAIQSLK